MRKCRQLLGASPTGELPLGPAGRLQSFRPPHCPPLPWKKSCGRRCATQQCQCSKQMQRVLSWCWKSIIVRQNCAVSAQCTLTSIRTGKEFPCEFTKVITLMAWASRGFRHRMLTMSIVTFLLSFRFQYLMNMRFKIIQSCNLHSIVEWPRTRFCECWKSARLLYVVLPRSSCIKEGRIDVNSCRWLMDGSNSADVDWLSVCPVLRVVACL